MRWLALLGGVFLVVAVLAFRMLPESAPAPEAKAPAAAAPVVPASAAPAVQLAPHIIPPEPPAAAPRIVVRGIVYLQGNPGNSHALMSVAGSAAQVFRRGELVDDAWVVDAIRGDHVIVARDATKVRLDVVGERSAAQAPAAMASSAAAAASDRPLPGFVRAPEGVAAQPPVISREQNRRFLADRQKAANAPARQ